MRIIKYDHETDLTITRIRQLLRDSETSVVTLTHIADGDSIYMYPSRTATLEAFRGWPGETVAQAFYDRDRKVLFIG